MNPFIMNVCPLLVTPGHGRPLSTLYLTGMKDPDLLHYGHEDSWNCYVMGMKDPHRWFTTIILSFGHGRLFFVLITISVPLLSSVIIVIDIFF